MGEPVRCGACARLGAAIDSGVRYCHRDLTWRWAHELRVCDGFEALANPQDLDDTAAALAQRIGAHYAG